MKKMTLFYDKDRYILDIILKLMFLLDGEAWLSYQNGGTTIAMSNT
jgi:hypothetical protein